MGSSRRAIIGLYTACLLRVQFIDGEGTCFTGIIEVREMQLTEKTRIAYNLF